MPPKVSIIVPVYKTEAFLHRCVDSILNQKFQNFELLLIDDGSPDRSGKICDEYSKKDKRVRTFHKVNEGVSSARNYGLDNACGEWICFIDSDDYWETNNFLSSISSINKNVDLIHFGYKKETKTGKTVKFCNFKEESLIDTLYIFRRDLFSSCSVSYFYSAKHINKNKLRFNEAIKYSEDREFIIKNILLSSKQILLLPNCDYIYTYNISSATNAVRTFNHCIDDLIVLKNIYNLIRKNQIKLTTSANSFLSYLMIDSYILSISITYKHNYEMLSKSSHYLSSICKKYPELDCQFFRYKCFKTYPRITSMYYNVRRFLRNIIHNI